LEASVLACHRKIRIVPTENSIALKKREQHSRGNEFLGLSKHFVESPSCERRAVSAPGAEDHRRGVCVYIKEEAMLKLPVVRIGGEVLPPVAVQ
jgi:hypothetical protein